MNNRTLQETEHVSIESYASALGSRYENVCFDQASGRLYRFKSVFYPTSVGEGAAAFQSYAEQMRKAETAFESAAGKETLDPLALFELIDERVAIEEQDGDQLAFEHNRLSSKEKGSRWLEDSTSKFKDWTDALLDEIDSALYGIGASEADIQAQSIIEKPTIESQGEAALRSLDAIGDSDEQGLADGILSMLNSGENINLKRSTDQATKDIATSGETTVPSAKGPSADLLMTEPLAKDDPSIAEKLVVGNRSRILLIASAGHGKTTILRRIALYYCDALKNRLSSADVLFAKKYGLPTSFGLAADMPIPCIIELRNISLPIKSVEGLIVDSIGQAIRAHIPNANYNIEGIERFVSSIRDRMFLLVDGLDELADEFRLPFLETLSIFLEKNDKIPVILSTRVAGVLSDNIRAKLRNMQFRGRTALPLSERQSREYSEQWIGITQDGNAEEEARLLSVLDQVFSEGKYSFLKDFMRTPLELVTVLKQLTNGVLSLSRYQLFHDMLWDFFTRHEEYSRKSSAFEDSISILGLIAYWMQTNATLFVTKGDIETMLPDFDKLSLYSDSIDCRTAEGVIHYLDQVASNVGVIEKGEKPDGAVFTFPIRAYQEYLTAYACCHLCLDPGGLKPDPKGIAEAKMHDPYWNNVMCFLLIELEANGHGSYAQLLNQLFGSIADLDHLQSLIESDIFVDYESACTLADRFFSYSVLPEKESELLSACVRSKSFAVFESCIERKYRADATHGNGFLWAMTYVSMYRLLTEERSPYQAAQAMLLTTDGPTAMLGASMIEMILGFELDGMSLGFNNRQIDIAKAGIRIDKATLTALYNGATRSKNPIFVQALTSLWISKVSNSEFAGRLLGRSLRNLMLDTIADSEHIARRALFAGKNAYKSPDYARMLLLLRTLGSMPFEAPSNLAREFGPYTRALLECLYERSRSDYAYNTVAFAIAGLYICWSEKRFQQAWCFDVCAGRRSELVSKATALPRERNLFELVRDAMIPYEEAFYRDANSSAMPEQGRNQLSDTQKSQLDELTPLDHILKNGRRLDTQTNDISTHRLFAPDSQHISEVDLFRSGDIDTAIEVCKRSIEKTEELRSRESKRINLAFLIRYAANHGNSAMKSELATVPELLVSSVEKGEPYALANLGMYFIEKGEPGRAEDAFYAISKQGWEAITAEFWWPVMWQEKREPEGALLCILANRLANCQFKDFDAMNLCIAEDFPWLHLGVNFLA